MNNSLGENISKIRKQKGLSQRRLARMAQVSYSTISRIEAGIVTPDLTTIKKLSTALKINMKDFIEIIDVD